MQLENFSEDPTIFCPSAVMLIRGRAGFFWTFLTLGEKIIKSEYNKYFTTACNVGQAASESILFLP